MRRQNTKTFRYPSPHLEQPRPQFYVPKRAVEPPSENLTGYVQGRAASRQEELIGRALDKSPKIRAFLFEEPFIEGRNKPGQIEGDFAVYTMDGRVFVLQYDGEYAHKGIAQKEKDRMNDAILFEALKDVLSGPVIRVPSDMYRYEIDSPEDAKKMVEEVF